MNLRNTRSKAFSGFCNTCKSAQICATRLFFLSLFSSNFDDQLVFDKTPNLCTVSKATNHLPAVQNVQALQWDRQNDRPLASSSYKLQKEENKKQTTNWLDCLFTKQQYKVTVHRIFIHLCSKPLDTFGKQYCPRPTLRVSQLIYKITNLWKAQSVIAVGRK